MQTLYVQKRIGEIRVVGFNGRREVVYLYVEREMSKSRVGQISMARVIDVNKSLSLAYVDMGNCHATVNTVEKMREGDSLPLQIIRDAFSTKLATASTTLSVGNRFFSLTTGKKFTYCPSIREPNLKTQLTQKMIGIHKEGLCVKAPAIAVSKKVLEQQYRDVRHKMDTLKHTIHTACKGDTIVHAPSMMEKVLFHVEAGGNIVSDDTYVYNALKGLSKMAPDVSVTYLTQPSVSETLQRDAENTIEEVLQECLSREIPLSNGGSIAFDQTEALTAIDVNGGGVKTVKGGDDAIFDVNVCAIRQIARHICLRNICGLIVIDFIRFNHRGRQKQLVKVLHTHLRFYDPTGIWKVIGLTKAGLVEVTRKRSQKSLGDVMFAPLKDRSLDVHTLGLEALNTIVQQKGVGVPTIYAPKHVIDIIKKGDLKIFKIQAEKILGKSITFEQSATISVGVR